MNEPPGLLVMLFDLSAAMGREDCGAAAVEFAGQLMEAVVGTGLPVEVKLRGVRKNESIPLKQLSDIEGYEGDPAPAEALAAAYRDVARWLAGKSNPRPPVVVHCTSGLGFTQDYFRQANSLTALATPFGSPRLWHARYAPTDEAEEEAFAPAHSFGASFNGAPLAEVWDVLFEERPQSDTFTENHGAPGFVVERAFQLQKHGNEPEQWEDGFAIDAGAGVAAICDGASEGIFCRKWAEILATRFVRERPDAEALAEFVVQCRQEWRTAIDAPNLKWSAQNKVEGVGAAATLCALSVGLPAANGARSWRALAVGDAVLFRVRHRRLLQCFPLTARDQLDSAPDLLRTLPRGGPAVVSAEGRCLPGDLFLLATDAVAGHLFETSGNLDRYAAMNEDDWRAEIAALRGEGRIVNDDCTLLVLRIPTVEENLVDLTPQPPFRSGDREKVDDLAARVQAALREQVAPALELDGGEIEVVEIVNGIASVRLGAVCASCPGSVSAIVALMELELRKHVPEIEMIEPVG